MCIRDSAYTEKIDCFSFGVICIQILTRRFPEPGDRLQRVEFDHPGLPRGTLMVRVPEVDRRQTHISELDPTNCLLLVALDCLNDQDTERPSAQQLCERVATLKGNPQYSESVRTIQGSGTPQQGNSDAQHVGGLQQMIQSQTVRLEERDEEIQQLRQQLRNQDSEKYEIIQERERQIGQLNQQLEMSKKMIALFDRRVTDLEQQLSQRSQLRQEASRTEIRDIIRLKWREEERSPYFMSRRNSGDAVVDGSIVYMIWSQSSDSTICTYQTTNNTWSTLPRCPVYECPIAVINGLLTTIGGYMSSSQSKQADNKLFSLAGEDHNRKWTEKFPPMPTCRSSSSALCTGTSLIVAGGRDRKDEDRVMMRKVEVMNTETCQWSTAADLPAPRLYSSVTICGDSIYMLGGRGDKQILTRSVYTCSLSVLLKSCQPAHTKSMSLENQANVWRRVEDLLVIGSTCLSLNGQLLAVGGIDPDDEFVSAVHMYNPTTDSCMGSHQQHVHRTKLLLCSYTS